MDNNTTTFPQNGNGFEVKIVCDTLNKADGIIQTVLVPEYFLGGNKPLAIRLQDHHIQFWMWDSRKRASAKFAVLADGYEYDFSDEGLMVSNHMGTVFDDDGNALHVVRLAEMQVSAEPLGMFFMEGNYTADDGDSLMDTKTSFEFKDHARMLIERIKKELPEFDIADITYEGKQLGGHVFKWRFQSAGIDTHASLMSGFDKLEKYGLKIKTVDVEWGTKLITISFSYIYEELTFGE